MTAKTFHGIPVPDDDLDSFAPRPSDVPTPPAHVWPPSGARVRLLGTDTEGTFSRAVYSTSLARVEWMVRWDANGDIEWGYAPERIEVLDMPKRQYPLYARGERITGTPVKRRVRGPACEADDVELAPPAVATMDVFLDADTDISALRTKQSLVVNAVANGVRFRLHLTVAAESNLATEITLAQTEFDAKRGSK